MIVDLPPEEDPELCDPALAAGLDWIRFVTPTSDQQRLARLLPKASGFLYYVSVNGVSGSRALDFGGVRERVLWLRSHTTLPIAVGFGIRTAEDVAVVAEFADAVVVGSALAERIEASLAAGCATGDIIGGVEEFVRDLAAGLARLDLRTVPNRPDPVPRQYDLLAEVSCVGAKIDESDYRTT